MVNLLSCEKTLVTGIWGSQKCENRKQIFHFFSSLCSFFQIHLFSWVSHSSLNISSLALILSFNLSPPLSRFYHLGEIMVKMLLLTMNFTAFTQCFTDLKTIRKIWFKPFISIIFIYLKKYIYLIASLCLPQKYRQKILKLFTTSIFQCSLSGHNINLCSWLKVFKIINKWILWLWL